MSLNDIYSLRKRGNSYLIVVSMGYDCAGNRLKSMQQVVADEEILQKLICALEI